MQCSNATSTAGVLSRASMTRLCSQTIDNNALKSDLSGFRSHLRLPSLEISPNSSCHAEPSEDAGGASDVKRQRFEKELVIG